MPYGQPVLNATDQYWMRATHAATGLTFTGQIEQDGAPEEDRDEAFQSIVNVLDAAQGWTIVAATKKYEAFVNVTATP